MDSVASPPSSVDDDQQNDGLDQQTLSPSISKQAIIAELILLRVPQFGPASYWALQEHFGNGEAILTSNLNHCRGLIRQSCVDVLNEVKNNEQHPLRQQAQTDFEWLSENNVKVIAHHDSRYPSLLKTTHNPPPVLFVQGEINNLFLPQLAIVGSRNPSPAGRENALHFSQQLAAMGFVITSGMALGIDAAAHQGALKSNLIDSAGSTIAVIGTGIDKIYPRSHARLHQQILDNGGTIVTEFPLGVGPQASHFPRRNRIISGMSLGVLVVEAAIKSGSLITARYALQQNREVFAIPGSIHNPLSRGCHALLREGANLVESINDMREPLTGLLEFKWKEISSHRIKNNLIEQQSETGTPLKQQLSHDESVVLKQLDFDQTTIDVLEQRTQLSPGILLSALMTLELKGLIEQQAGNYQRLPSKA